MSDDPGAQDGDAPRAEQEDAGRTDASDESGARRGATTWIAIGSTGNGLAAFGFQLVGTRALGPEGYAPIGVLWTLQYLWIAIAVTAVEAYVTRMTTVGGPASPDLARFLRLFGRWLLAAAVAVTAAGWVLRDVLFDGTEALAVALGLVVLGYGWYGVVRGRAAGTDRFRAYGVATAAESVLRFLAAAAVLAVSATTRSLAWVFPIGPLTVIVWARLRTPGLAAVPDSDGRAPTSANHRRRGGRRFLAAASSANASVQFLLAGGPLVLLALGADAVAVAVFFTTITAARIPMTFALNGGLSRLLPPLTRLSEADDVAGLRRTSGWLVAAIVTAMLAAVGGAAALGPEVIALLFGEGFRPSRGFTMLIGAGTVLAVGGLLLDQVYIATHREARLPAVWLSAVAVAVVLVIVLPATPTMRVATAFTVATAAAVTALAVPMLRRWSRT